MVSDLLQVQREAREFCGDGKIIAAEVEYRLRGKPSSHQVNFPAFEGDGKRIACDFELDVHKWKAEGGRLCSTFRLQLVYFLTNFFSVASSMFLNAPS